MENKNCVIYIFEIDGLLKFGISSNVERRQRQYLKKYGSINVLKIFEAMTFDDAAYLEWKLRRAAKRENRIVKGFEWTNYSINELLKLVKKLRQNQ